jgi:hypothetical protein
MAHYPRTPRMVTPMLGPQPVLYTSSPYQAAGSRHQLYHVAASEPSYPRGHRRSSSRSRNHRRSHSSSGRHHRHHRSSTPTHSIPSHYSPAAQYAVSYSHVYRSASENANLTLIFFLQSIPTTRQRRHSYSLPNHQYRNSSRDPHRPSHYRNHEHHHMSHRGESIGERIKRFFGIGANKVRFVDHSGHQVDRFGRPVYAL